MLQNPTHSYYNKKAVLVIPKDSSYYHGLIRAFEFLGIQVTFFDCRQLTPVEKLIKVVSKESSISSLNNRLLHVVEVVKPDLLFVMKAELVSPETVQKINAKGVKTINWFPDHVNAFDLAFKLSGVYEYFFHFDPQAISELKKAGRKNIYYLPFASDLLPDDQNVIPSKIYDVMFIGNFDKIREKYLNEIKDQGLTIFGDSKWESSILRNNYKGYLDKAKIKETLSASKICINIQHEYPSKGLVLRVFEILGAGSFLLSDDREDFKNLFKINEDLSIFKDKKEIREKTQYFLANSGKREKIAKSGFQAVQARHTYVHRLKQVLDILY